MFNVNAFLAEFVIIALSNRLFAISRGDECMETEMRWFACRSESNQARSTARLSSWLMTRTVAARWR